MLGHSVFNPFSPQALAISNLFIFVLFAMLAICLLIVGGTVYVVIRYRYRPGDGEPPQIFGNTKIENAWTISPFILLLVVFGFTINVIRFAQPPDHPIPALTHEPGHADLEVIGHQWWWEIRYTGSGVVTANEIHLPTGTRWVVALKSADVIHSL